MLKSVFQGLFRAEVDNKWSMVLPVKQKLYDLAAYVYRAFYGEVEIVTDNKTLTVADSGKTFLIGTDAKAFTLPAVADAPNCKYTFVNIGANGNNIITISPNASDAIYGTMTLAAADTVFAATDNKDLINTKATAKKGDSVTIVSDSADGWVVTAITGVWAKES